MPVDPNQVGQDKDFLAASSDDQIKYLSTVDSDFAKASRADQLGYIQHLTGKAPVTPKVPKVTPNNDLSFSQAFGNAQQNGPNDEDIVNSFDTSHPILGKLARTLVAGGNTIMQTPAMLKNAFTAPATPEENSEVKDTPESLKPLALGTYRLLQEPTDIATHDYLAGNVSPKAAASVLPEALGTGIGTVSGSAFIPKLTELAKDVVPKPITNNVVKNTYTPAGDHISAALRSNARVDVPAEAKIAHPAIEEGLADRGYTTQDFKGRNGPTVLQSGIDNAIDLTEARAKQIIDPIRGEVVDPKVLADNPELAARLKDKKQVTYGDVDAERLKMNKELRRANFYSKDPSMQYAIGDPLANTEAAAGQARDLVYTKAEQTTGLDLRPIKRTESALIKLGDLAETTKNTLSSKGAVHERTPLLKKVGQSAKTLIAAKANPISSFFSYEKPGVVSPLSDFNSHMQKAFPDLSPSKANTTVTFPKYNLNLKSPSGSASMTPIQQLLRLSGGENVPGEDLKLTPPPGETPGPSQLPLEMLGEGHFGERGSPLQIPEQDLNMTSPGNMPPALQRVLGFENPGVPSELYPGKPTVRVRAGVKK